MSRILLDTQAFIYATMNNPALSEKAREILSDSGTEKLLSYASVWEMSIKLGIGKLTLPEPLGPLLDRFVDNESLTLVGINLSHLLATEVLPAQHGDPFDRLIASMCLVEGLEVLSNDVKFDAYGVRRVW